VVYLDILESTVRAEMWRNYLHDENIINGHDGLESFDMAEKQCVD